jgi:hypothetical protein
LFFVKEFVKAREKEEGVRAAEREKEGGRELERGKGRHLCFFFFPLFLLSLSSYLRPGLADADELVRLHGGVGEGDELRVDADGRELLVEGESWGWGWRKRSRRGERKKKKRKSVETNGKKKETIAAVARPFLLVFSGGLTLLNDLPRACDVKRNLFLTPQAKEGMEKRSRRRREREQKEAKKEHGRRRKPIAERTTTATRGG